MIPIKELINKVVEQLPKIGLGILVLVVFILAAWLIKRIISKRVRPKSKNPLLAVFLGKVVSFCYYPDRIYILSSNSWPGGHCKTYYRRGRNYDLCTWVLLSRILAKTFYQALSWHSIVLLKLGTSLKHMGTIGYVYELNMRVTAVKTLDGKDVFIPNAQIIKSPFSNYTIDGFLRYEMTIGVDYNTDLKKTIQAINTCLAGIDQVLKGDKKPVVVVDELAVEHREYQNLLLD